MLNESLSVLPSLAISPSFRAEMAATYRQLADVWRSIERPDEAAKMREKAAICEYGGDLDLEVLLHD